MSERYELFLRGLQQDLRAPLPGREVQYRMAPRPRPGADFSDKPTPNARRGAVLMLFYPWQNEIYLPLILRPNYSGVHSGQIGLPGGGQEAIDADLSATALREAYEEIGVRSDSVTVLGWMSELFVSASNYLVQPVVGWTDFRPQFHLDPYEVAALIEAPLSDFMRPDNQRQEIWQLRNLDVTVPFYHINSQIIWGATAMMLSELLALPAIQKLARAGAV